MKILIKENEIFGLLSVIKESERRILPSGQKVRQINCKCDCGVIKDVLLVHLIRGKIKSCGCLHKTKLGESNTQIHRRYKTMIERCYPNAINHRNYFDRGIKVCDEWVKDYFAFKKWAIENGFMPNLTIDRIDNSLGYSPENCRFISAKENCNNRRNTQIVNYKCKDYPITELFDLLGIKERHRHSIRCRLIRGWNVENAFDTPIKQGNYSKKK